jgi:hypothetical protein
MVIYHVIPELYSDFLHDYEKGFISRIKKRKNLGLNTKVKPPFDILRSPAIVLEFMHMMTALLYLYVVV